MSFLSGWWGGKANEGDVYKDATAASAATESTLVDPEASVEDQQKQQGEPAQGYFAGVRNYLWGKLGWEDLEVTKIDRALSETGDQLKATKEQRNNLWTQVSSFIGMDPISMLSLPVWIFEPTSFLQRMAEPFVYADFLYKAAEAKTAIDRLAWIAAFNVSIMSNTERTGKPFNPVLGETFEYVSPKGYRFLAEQVSHHPPVGVAETTCDQWIVKQEALVKTKFNGNSIEIFAVGTTHLIFPQLGEHYSWRQPNSCVHNIFVGGMWIDHWGDIEIESTKGGAKCLLKFHKCGWFSDSRYQVTGEIKDEEGDTRILLIGKWNDFLCAKNVSKEGKKSNDEYYLWQREHENPDNKWKLPKFTKEELCGINEQYERVLPPSDSRLRADRRALEAGDLSVAGQEKHRIEENQRRERQERERSGEQWEPKQFQRVEHEKFEYIWNYVGDYWKKREESEKQLAK